MSHRSPELIRSCLAVLIALLPVGAARGQAAPADQPAPKDVRLAGRVVTWDGKPIVGAAIRYEEAAASTTAELLREPHAVTDATGGFSFVVKAVRRGDPVVRQLTIAAKGMAAIRRSVTWKRKGSERKPGGEVDDGDDDAAVPSEDTGWSATPAQTVVEYADETTMDDLVLAPGHRLTGRVRDAAGKPLAGVRVEALDSFEQSNAFRGGRHIGFCCTATSNASGIFDLPGALPLGSRLTFRADGHYTEQLEPVAAGTPIEVALQPSGWIQGRVLDPDGRSIAEASVQVNYERLVGSESEPLRTGPDGSFRTTLQRPGRWRLTATRRHGNRADQGHSPVFTGGRENLEVIIKSAADAPGQRLPIRVVDKRTGQPVARCKIAAVWDEYASQNANYLEYRFTWTMREAKVTEGGQGDVMGPDSNDGTVGAVRAIAPGYAPATKKQLEWKEPEKGQQAEPVLLELEPEATVRGVVVDETSGQPIAGARVYAKVHQDPNQGSYDDHRGVPPEAATTAADGSFRIGGLGEGRWDVLVSDPKRPRAPTTEVELTAAEAKTGVVIRLAAGAAVAGKLTGITPGHGTKVFLSKVPRQTFGESNQYYSYVGGSQPSTTPVAVGADGSFRIEGTALDNRLLVVQEPSPPRLGGDLYLPIEPFRVRAAGVQRDFDCSEDRPGTIRGKLTFADAATVPFEQMVVVARLVQEEGRQFFSPFNTQWNGPRSFVTASGEYELRVGPGTYQLSVVDLQTAIQLHDEATKLEVKTGATISRDLRLVLARIELELKAAADTKEMAPVDRIEIRIVDKAMKENGVQIGGNDNYDTGAGLRWPLGATKLSVVLPLGEATFLCRTNTTAIRIDDNRWENPPPGRGELEITAGAGAKTACTIEVGAPPEIPDPEQAKKDAEAAAEGAEAKPAEAKKGDRP